MAALHRNPVSGIRKLLAVTISLAMALSLIPAAAIPQQAEAAIATASIQSICNKYNFKTGWYWKSSYSTGRDSTGTYCDKGYTASSKNLSHEYKYNGAYQCQGFARFLARQITGYEWTNSKWKNWKLTSKDSLQVGNLIYHPSHSAIVYKVSGGNAYFAECWGNSSNRLAIGSYGFNGARRYTAGSIASAYSGAKLYRFQGSAPSPTPTVATPSIKTSDIIGGKQVNISTSTGGSTIRYTIDGKTNPSASVGNVYSRPFTDTWPIMGVRAVASKGGWNTSGIAYNTIYTSQVATPSISVSNTPTGAVARITSTGGVTIYYTTNGSNPTMSSTRYTGDVKLTSSATVKAIAVKAGMRNSGIATRTIVCAVPAKPVATLQASKIAVNDAVQVSWEADSAAASYDVKLYKDGQQVQSTNTQGAVASFALSAAGDYEIGVTAKNYYGDSAESNRVAVSAMPDCKVRFVDKHESVDGTKTDEVLNEQVVRYGYGAEKPVSPSKRGYSFDGWARSFDVITEDTDVAATWKINTYTVEFFASDATTSLSRQRIQYQSGAVAPTPPDPRTGYVFTGWQVTNADDDSARDYTKVDSNMKLVAVYSWGDKDLPTVAAITDARRTAAGIYTVSVKLNNYPYDATTAMLRVALKTQGDKLVQTARETVSIAQDSEIERTVTLKYTGDNIATKAEVEIVGLDGNYRTGGAYSKAVTANILTGDGFSYTPWSEWGTEQPTASDTVQVEEGVQYRYRDKQTTSNTATSLEGWTRDGTTSTTYGAWSANKTTTTKPTASDTLRIVSSKITKYTYYRYCSYYDKRWNQDSKWINSSSVYHEVSTSSPMTACANKFADKGGKAWDLHGPYGNCSHKRTGQSYWWTKSTTTTYTYQTRTKTINYGYYKWDDASWSDWSTDIASASESRQVQQRPVYKYRTKINTEGTEDSSGERYSVSGKLPAGTDLSGKEATIMVYNATNSDPNEDQLQYIGQTVLGEGNSYEFSFIPKKELSAESGDLIVALGVKGATGLVNVDVIKAPRAKYKVTFQYQADDGSNVVVGEQDVADGDNAVIPEAPQRAGLRFAGWDDSAQRVNAPLIINAKYDPQTYTIAWVNWASDDIILQTYGHGDELVAPADVEQIDGLTFKGWDALMNATTTATRDMVINAVYEAQTFDAQFVDDNGKAISSQKVEYGHSAELPAVQPESEGKVFMGWSTSEDAPWWNVKSDLTIGALFAYEQTADSPVADVPEEEGYVGPAGAKVTLASATEDAAIYYTTDGSEPSVPGVLSQDGEDENTSKAYDAEEGIVVKKPLTIRAIAVKAGLNDSCETAVDVDVTATNDISHAECMVSDAVAVDENPVEPGVGVWFGDLVLEPGVDYKVSYSHNEGVGQAAAFVEGIGEYTGSRVVNFTILSLEEAEKIYGDDGDSTGEGTPKSSTKKTVVTLSKGSITAADIKAAVTSDTTTVTLGSKVAKIVKGAFAGTKVKTLVVKSKKLKKGSVKGALKGSKVKTVQVKVGSSKTNKKYAKKYKKIFTKKNCGAKVKVK